MENFDVFQEDFEAKLGFRKTLTAEEVEIAVVFLTKRFPYQPIQSIVDKLYKHNELKKNLGHIPVQLYQRAINQGPTPRAAEQEEIPRRNISRQPQPIKQSAEEKKIKEKQNLKLISTLFCQKGVDYDYAKIYIPDLTPSNYRSKLESIMNSALKQLMAFLRKQCNVRLQDLSENQKITIKTALFSAHEWMGVKSTTAIQTLFKFICKIYVNRHKLITKEEAIQLYRVIVARMNDQTLDMLFIEPQNEFGDQIQQKVRPSFKKTKNFENQEQLLQLIAQTFLDLFNPQKVSNYLLSKYGLDPRFDLAGINGYLRQIFEITLTKIDKAQNNRANRFFDSELIKKIMDNSLLKVQYSLVQLFLAKKQDKAFQRKVMKQLIEIQSKDAILYHKEVQLQEEEKSEHQIELEIQESIERQEYFNSISGYYDQKIEKGYDTNGIFEQIFDVELPSYGRKKLKQFNPRPQSSKKQEAQEEVIYFDD